MEDFDKLLLLMKEHKLSTPEPKIYIRIANAKEILKYYFSEFLKMQGRELIWIPEYDEVADWLTDNKGKGLFMYGNCGRGKSMLLRFVLPAIILKYRNIVMRSYNIQDLKDIDEILKMKLISVDDVGTEDALNEYGTKREAFAELIDHAEKYSKLLIASSNLYNGDGDDRNSLQGRYGTRVVERIISTTKRVEFKGESLRI